MQTPSEGYQIEFAFTHDHSYALEALNLHKARSFPASEKELFPSIVVVFLPPPYMYTKICQSVENFRHTAPQ